MKGGTEGAGRSPVDNNVSIYAWSGSYAHVYTYNIIREWFPHLHTHTLQIMHKCSRISEKVVVIRPALIMRE